MFGIDFSEILVIFVIALVVLGPEKLPKLAQNIGRWMGRARAMARQFREQLEQEAETLRRDTDPHIHNPLHDPVTAGQSLPEPPAAVASRDIPASAAGTQPHVPSHPLPADSAGAATPMESHERGT